MKKQFVTFLLCTVATCFCSLLHANEFSQLMSKIRQDFACNPSRESIEKALSTYNPDNGSFTDVDYASIQRTNWPPLTHIDRLYDFAFAYTTPGNPYYEDEALFQKTVKGLEYWYERNPWCHNWWYNQIAEPQRLGILLIQLRTGKLQIPAELEQKTLERIRKDGGNPAKWTGANRTDIALHWIYRACLQENEEDLTFALDNVYNPIVYTTKEGFQHDNSYFQHGRQLYIGGYGDEILKGITQVASYTKGTRFAIPQDKLQLLSKFMRETYYATIRGKHMLFDVLGRGVSRPHILDKSHTALFAKRMIQLDTLHADEFRAIVDRLEEKQPASFALTPKHTHYFRGDYTLHIRPHYTFDVRLVSTRTMRCEYGNGENLKTYFLSDGCTNIVTTGQEYYDIFPTWNWTRIPGVTAPQLAEIPMAKSDWQTPGTSTFAGGVSDSLYGVTAYAYTDTLSTVRTGAKKAWFFFDEEVVCLGADIQSASAAEINTTLNQCLSPEGTNAWLMKDGKLQALPEGETCLDAPQYVIHQNIAYLFPEPQSVFASLKMQNGNWYDINHSAPKSTLQNRVFTLGINHGKQPDHGQYAYIVVPGKEDAKQVARYQKKKSVEILANTGKVQVVRNRELNIWGMVFHKPGTYTDKRISITVDKPCILMVNPNGKQTARVHVADPTQRETYIRIQIQMPSKSKKVQTVQCHFPGKGVYAGATQAYDVPF